MPQGSSSQPKRTRKAHEPGARAGKGGAYTGDKPPLSDWRIRPLPEPLDERELVRLHEQGVKAPAIAKQLGQTYSRVRDYLHAHGLGRLVRQKRRTARHGFLLYRIWRDNRRRCSNPRRADWATYGGRGIRFGWRDDFDGFYDWAMRTGFEPGLCLDRRDRDADFGPRNCHWVTKHEIYTRLPKRALVLLTAFGECKSMAEWSRDPRCLVSKHGLGARVYRGWPHEQAIALAANEQPTHYVKPPRRPDRSHLRHHIDWEEAVALYSRGRATTRELAERYGATMTGIANGLRQRGLRLRPLHTRSNDPRLDHLAKVWSRINCISATRRSPHYVGPGQKGVLLCKAWRTADGFIEWAKKQGPIRGLCFVRKDLSKPYSPQNCAWVPPSEVKRRPPTTTKPRGLRMITAFGETKCIAAWVRDPRARVSAVAMRYRLARGATTEEAISGERRGGGNFEFTLAPVRAFGTSMSPVEWLRDPRCRILSVGGLRKRLKSGWDPEAAISTPAFDEPRRGQRAGRVRRKSPRSARA